MLRLQMKEKETVLSLFVTLILGASTLGGSITPPPDNAALLYYQAFWNLPSPGDELSETLYWIPHGGEITLAVREYIKDNQKGLELVEAASKIPHCNWGLRLAQDELSGQYRSPLLYFRLISELIQAQVRILVEERKYQEAIEQSLILYRFAVHIPVCHGYYYLMSGDSRSVAYENIVYILECVPTKEEDINWLQKQFADVFSFPKSHVIPLKLEMASHRQITGDIPGWVVFWEKFDSYLHSVTRIASLQMPYKVAYKEYKKLDDHFWFETVPAIEEEIPSGSANKGYRLFLGLYWQTSKMYSCQIRAEAKRNATLGAIELYRLYAKEGQLPSELPTLLPKDPFSDKPFVYEITNEGFLLRCQQEDLKAGKVQEFRFTVSSE